MTDRAAEQEARELLIGLNIDNAHREPLVSLITAALQRRDDELARQIEHNDGWVDRFARLSAILLDTEKERDALKTQYEVAQRDLDENADEIVRIQSDLAESRAQLAEAQREIERLRAIIDDAPDMTCESPEARAWREKYELRHIGSAEWQRRAEQAEAQVRALREASQRLHKIAEHLSLEIIVVPGTDDFTDDHMRELRESLDQVEQVLTTPPAPEGDVYAE